MSVGVAGFSSFIPSGKMTARDLSEKTGVPENIVIEKIGVREKPVAALLETPSYMAIEASKKALAMAGVAPEEIDCIIYCGGQHKDYPCWLAGLKVAESLGAKRAWAFDMEAMCGSMMVAMEVGRSLLEANVEYSTVLLASGYRNGDLIDYGTKETSFMNDIGAGGAAMVLKKGHDENLILGSSFKGDGSFSEDCIVEVGGAKNWPMKPGDVGKYHFTVRDIDSFKKKLAEKTLVNFYQVIREALKKAGREKIDYLGILHFKRSTHEEILRELGLDESRTTYLENYGHIGQNDQVISLEEGLKNGKLHDGDIVVLVGAGIGFVWAASVIGWGRGGKERKL